MAADRIDITRTGPTVALTLIARSVQVSNTLESEPPWPS